MRIKFFLKADKVLDKSGERLGVREYFKLHSDDMIVDAAGTHRPRLMLEGLVDDEIKASNKQAYEAFRAYVDANDARLNDLCRANPGQFVNVTELMETPPAPAIKEEGENGNLEA